MRATSSMRSISRSTSARQLGWVHSQAARSEPSAPRFSPTRTGAKPRALSMASICLSGTSAPMTRRNSARVRWIFLGARLPGYTSTTPASSSPPASCRMSSAARREASSAVSGSAPRPKRVEASVWSFRKRAALRTAIGSNQAHSMRIFFVEKEISVSAPPMTPPMPTARDPSPSKTTESEESSVRSRPSRVRVFSPGFVVVVRVKRVAELEHDVIGDVDYVADAGDAAGFEAVFQPFWRWLDLCAANDACGEAAAEFGRLDFDFYGVGRFCCAFCRLRREGLQREFIDGAEFARDPVMAQTIGAVRAHFCIDDGAVRAVFYAADVGAGESQARGDIAGRSGDVDEFFQPVVDDLHARFQSLVATGEFNRPK